MEENNDVVLSNPTELADRSLVSMKEIEAKITVALKFPRDMTIVENDIKAMCSRVRFADGSTYSIPRGGKMVAGPSTHFAKGIAQLFKNFEHGHYIDSRDNKCTRGFAYAWDYERNIYIKKEFFVPHERKANNRIKFVTDPTEIMEMTNAQISRAVRNCILEIIPWYILEEAQELCAKTLRDEQKKLPIEKRREQAREKFRTINVDEEKVKKKMGKGFDELNDEELFELGGAYNAIKGGFITVSRWMGEEPEKEESNLERKMKEAEEKATAEAPKAEAPQKEPPAEPEKAEPKTAKKKTDKEIIEEYNKSTKGIKP